MHYGPIRAFVNFNEFIREYNEVKKQADKAQQDALRTANVYIHLSSIVTILIFIFLFFF